MGIRRVVLLLAAGLAFVAGPVRAQDAPKPGTPFGEDEPEPKPLTPEEQVASKKLFAEGKALLERDQYTAGKAKFREFLKLYPGADEDLLEEAEDRSGDNCLVGIEQQHKGGPPERRIDVELMGDGYIQKEFKKFAPAALSQMIEFWKDPLYGEYANYFNVWRFDLISKEDGVDELSPEEKGAPPPPPPKPGKRPKKKKELKKYSTALNCVAAGGQNQVMADPEQVMRWRKYLKCSDGLTIAFAKKGALGMGGGGIATTGLKVAVTHEFGHAFIGLLDEYTNNPNPPGGRVVAPNAISSAEGDPRKPPPMEEVPWKHWLTLPNAPRDVGLFLGGATYQLGVFRPAQSCAMNSAGAAFYCTVCREAGILRIYSYVGPIDEVGPIQERVTMTKDETREFFVVPMAPKSHPIQVEWTMQRISTGPLPPPEPALSDDFGGTSAVRDERAAEMWRREGDRAAARRANPLPDGKPAGFPLKATVKKMPGGAYRSSVNVYKLDPGGWKITARVFDDTKVPGSAHPWVIKDVDRLREEWREWTIDVTAPIVTPPSSAPPAGGGAGPGAPPAPPKGK